MQAQGAVYHTFPRMTRRIFLIPRFAESFAPRSDLLLSTVTKVGKSTGRNLRFLHLRARYALTQICGHIPHVRMRFPFSFCYRIVSAPAPLPLIITPNNASVSTVEKMSGSGARGIDDSSYAAKTTVSCERVVYGVKLKTRHSVRGFLNRRFKWRFWGAIRALPVADEAR